LYYLDNFFFFKKKQINKLVIGYVRLTYKK